VQKVEPSKSNRPIKVGYPGTMLCKGKRRENLPYKLLTFYNQ